MASGNSLNIPNYSSTTSQTSAVIGNNSHANEFALTLTSGDPSNTTTATAATTIYCCPMYGNNIALFNGTTWDVISSNQFSIAVPATTNTLYDIFCYNNSGVATLELLAWTSDTVRATSLAYQNGVLVKSTDNTRRFLGSVRTTGVSGQTECSLTKRLLGNYYNRSIQWFNAPNADATWTYNSYGTWRAANGNTSINMQVVLCDPLTVPNANILYQVGTKSSGTSTTAIIGISLDLVDPSNARGFGCSIGTGFAPAYAQYIQPIATGFHTFTPYEYINGSTDTVTFYKTVGVVVGCFRGTVFM